MYYKFILTLTSILCLTVSIVNAQDAPELEQSDIYGDLSEYLSWPMSATAFSGTDLSVMNRLSDRELADLIPNYSK
ncbi:MAG: hypothetical protein VYB73_02210, partial [Verrucomicrobiota bacterium]|nr:hypothetical protein [Verrucomicrobiota bacterium]